MDAYCGIRWLISDGIEGFFRKKTVIGLFELLVLLLSTLCILCEGLFYSALLGFTHSQWIYSHPVLNTLERLWIILDIKSE